MSMYICRHQQRIEKTFFCFSWDVSKLLYFNCSKVIKKLHNVVSLNNMWKYCCLWCVQYFSSPIACSLEISFLPRCVSRTIITHTYTNEYTWLVSQLWRRGLHKCVACTIDTQTHTHSHAHTLSLMHTHSLSHTHILIFTCYCNL